MQTPASFEAGVFRLYMLTLQAIAESNRVEIGSEFIRNCKFTSIITFTIL